MQDTCDRIPTEDVLIVALVVRWTIQAVEMAAVLAGERQWCVIEADCLNVLPWLADKSVSHVITDPPYDARTHAGARACSGQPGVIAFDRLEDPSALAVALLRVSRRWVVAFCALEMLADYQRGTVFAWVRSGVWDRVNPSPQLSGDRPAQAVEGIAIMHQLGAKRWNGGGKAAIWRHATPRGDERPDHPTPKPLPLMIDLLEDFTDPGEVILDAFAGSGTTGVAALRLGRRAILIERDAKYAAIARQRMEAEERGQSLKEYRAGQRTLWEA